MKHELEQDHYYILKIYAGKYSFEHRSADIYEILNALSAAGETFGFELDMAKAMKGLVDIEFNGLLSHKEHRWSVEKVEGEQKR